MTWTTKYPTEPGFYWIRNYRLKRWSSKTGTVKGPTLVQIYPMLDGFQIGSDWPFRQLDVECAQWCGPILPPQDKPGQQHSEVE